MREGRVADDDAAAVRVELPHEARLHAFHEVHELMTHGGRAEHLVEDGHRLTRAVRAQVTVVTPQRARQAVPRFRGQTEGAPEVLHGGRQAVREARRHHRLRTGAPAPLHPLDHLAAAGAGDVEVHVRHGLLALVEEAFEHQVVRERIDAGHAQQTAQDARGGRAASRREDALPLAVQGDLTGGEEEAREPEVLDDGELVREPFARGLPALGRVHARDGGVRDALEVLLRREVFGHVPAGWGEPFGDEVERALPRDP